VAGNAADDTTTIIANTEHSIAPDVPLVTSIIPHRTYFRIRKRATLARRD
jgi:hypothetical protein